MAVAITNELFYNTQTNNRKNEDIVGECDCEKVRLVITLQTFQIPFFSSRHEVATATKRRLLAKLF